MKIALVTIEFIVDLLKTLVALKRLLKKDSNGFHLAFVKNQRENKLKSKNAESILNKEKPTKVLPRQNCKVKTPLSQLECDSAVGLHLLQNPDCAAHYHDRQFSILAKARSKNSISLISSRSYFYQNIATNFMPAEKFFYSLQILQ